MTGITPDNIRELKPGQVFVFGSNLAGRHGKGAAKTALKFGARYGVGRGLQGNTYALPTKDLDVHTLPLQDIKQEIATFLKFANEHPELTFLVTKVGCGLAGYKVEEIAPLFYQFSHIPSNVWLPNEFWNYIEPLITQGYC